MAFSPTPLNNTILFFFFCGFMSQMGVGARGHFGVSAQQRVGGKEDGSATGSVIHRHPHLVLTFVK